MKKIYLPIANILGGLLAGALSLLGFSSCSDEELMYGTPTSIYETKHCAIKGTVRTATGSGVEGAQVIMRRLNGKDAYTSPRDIVTTDGKGDYLIKSDIPAVSELRIRIVCRPGDPALEADSIEMKLNFKGSGSDTASETADFTLKYKQENN